MVQYSSESLFVTLRCILIILCGIILAKRQTLKIGTAKTIYQMAENLYIPCLIFSNFLLNFQILDVSSWLGPILFAVAYVCLEAVSAIYLTSHNTENEALSSVLTKIWAANRLDLVPLAFVCLLEQGLNSLGKEMYSSELSNTARAIRSFLIFTLTASILRKIIAEKYFQVDTSQMEDSANLTPLPSDENQKGFAYYFKNIFNIIAVIAIVLSCIPPIKNLLTTDKNILNRTLTDSAVKCGLAVPALLLVQLGGLIFELKPDLQSAQLKIFAVLGLVKCIALPFISLILLQIFKFLSIIQDPVVEFQLLLCSAAPLAVTSAVAEYNSKQGTKLGSLFMWQYGLSILSTSVICHYFF